MRLTKYAVTLAVAAITASPAPAQVQLAKTGTAYYATADYTLTTNIVGNEVLVGKNTAFETIPGTITFTVAKGAKINQSLKGTKHGTDTHQGLIVFGNHRANITGGNAQIASIYNTAALNMIGGKLNHALGYDTGTINITGGDIFSLGVRNNSTVNIDGGSVHNVYGLDSGKIKVSGGTVTGGFHFMVSTATMNFVGKNLSFAHKGYAYSQPMNKYADQFTVSGTFGGASKTYNVYIKSDAGAEGTPNAIARQFTFNGVSPVAMRRK